MLTLLFSGRLLYGQENALYQSIEYKASGLTFEAALKGFETRIGLPIQYDAALAPKNRLYSFHYHNVKASQALSDFLSGAGLSFEYSKQQIFLKKREPANLRAGYRVAGRVISAGNGEFITGAHISILGYASANTTSDAGFFSLLLPKGMHVLSITYPGYEPITDTLLTDRDYNLQYEMRKQQAEMEEISIKGIKGRGLQSVQQGQTDQHEMNRVRMTWMPQLLGEPDVVRTLSMLPGVVGGSEGMLGMYVRGGAADQNLVMLDDHDAANFAPTSRPCLGQKLSTAIEFGDDHGEDRILSFILIAPIRLMSFQSNQSQKFQCRQPLLGTPSCPDDVLRRTEVEAFAAIQ